MLHTVFSISAAPAGYQEWQARLLALSHARVQQPGPLTCLVATEADPPLIPGAYVQTHPPASPHPQTGDNYPPYNKPAALAAWLATACPAEDTICILDPDCWFRQAVTPAVQRGQAVAQRMPYQDEAQTLAALRPYWDGALPPALVGIPLFLHRDDLAAVLPGWIRYTAAFRADPDLRAALGWVAEMWAYLLAATEAGIVHTTAELAWSGEGQSLEAPIVHYCYGYPEGARSPAWCWDKRAYHAWDAVPPWPATLPAPLQEMLTALNFLAAQERARRAPAAARGR